MDTSPISSWDDVSAFFTWGAESFGVWLFIILGVVLFVGMIAWAVKHENEMSEQICACVENGTIVVEGAAPAPAPSSDGVAAAAPAS